MFGIFFVRYGNWISRLEQVENAPKFPRPSEGEFTNGFWNLTNQLSFWSCSLLLAVLVLKRKVIPNSANTIQWSVKLFYGVTLLTLERQIPDFPDGGANPGERQSIIFQNFPITARKWSKLDRGGRVLKYFPCWSATTLNYKITQNYISIGKNVHLEIEACLYLVTWGHIGVRVKYV